MYKVILLPLALDHGHGVRIIELARRLRAEGGKVIAVHVLDQVPSYTRYHMSAENKRELSEHKMETIASAKKDIEERIGAQKDIEAVVLVGHPGRTMTDYAEKVGADCIIVGSHKPGLKDFFLGSTAARIVRYARCAVHVVR